jgi:hypothetical protein
MSLIDTWAATGAGAFTLTENGLYTREGWRVFLHSLEPTGVFGVSRWYEPNAFSETTRLLSLGVASLIDLGVDTPSRHLVLATSGRIATLMVSPAPFTAADGAALQAAADRYGFSLRVSPWHEADDATLRRSAQATTMPGLMQAAAHPALDFSPPSDARVPSSTCSLRRLLAPGACPSAASRPAICWRRRRSSCCWPSSSR